MKLKRTLFLLIITLASTSAAIAQNKVAKIDEMLNKYREIGQLNAAVLVAENGKVIYKKGHGLANMEWNVPIKTDTKFRIGSVTKQFTAVLILQLVDEGKIKLDGKVTDYLPYYRKDTGEKVTIHQLLNHTSGIPSYTNGEFFREHSRDYYSPEDFVKKFSSGDLEFEPGSKFRYNNSAYFILGEMIEKITGKSYADNLKERITKPLGMNNTGYDSHSPLLKNRAQGYSKTPAGYRNAAYLDMSLPYAAGSMFSTVEDLYKWDQALYGDKLMSAESKALMNKPGLQDYGYGVFIQKRKYGKTDKRVPVIQHGGGINGFNSLFTRVTDGKHLIVILDNVGQGNHHPNITNSVIAILNGENYELPKIPISEVLYKTVTEQGGDAAVAEYRRLKASSPDKYNFEESELNSLGYQLMGQKKKQEAIAIFKLNVELFPNSANPYDSLGEAYLDADDKPNALKYYKIAFEKDPKNLGAKAIIDRLEGREKKVAVSELQKYVGSYLAGPIGKIVITIEDGKLMGQPTGQRKLELTPTDKNVFLVAEVNARLTFKEENGEITGFTLNQNGQELEATKEKP